MENQFINNSPQNYYKRRFAVLFVFSIFLIFLGRHLTFLPTVNLSMNTKEEDLVTDVSEITKDKKGFYSIYYKNLDTGKSFGIDEAQMNTGASVNKVPIIASLYLLAKEGKINLDDRITIQESDVQDYGTGSIRYQKMPQVYSLRNLARLALKESDNTAAHVIEIRIGEENVQKLVDSWGMTQTNMVENKTTPLDMGILFEKIYRGQIADGANTQELLEFMSDTNFEDRIPKGVPSNINTYHKTGDGEGFIHDVGLVSTNNGTYYLGVMTSDIGETETETKNTIAEISKKVFESVGN